ncbi:MAG: hypothetical protein B7Y12_20420 [Rhizobiales bacterium 24-66-13]|jgi:hypothetical protein|nr:MAG: hypothetical protein B7Y61_10555 [Rhizobiales bacterium 35-66-30]OYZ68523.1 MAG: hypothetical protein B7Y12_20420 [Rhizobiales bacterium 24-66-13]OZA98168.1 MAG: hypothetical protein B7X67_22305 [Rhizobiales bacterium 39-66-18]HQS07848.1 hypothetical protein [Xanthobacteraceae bacterium]HQS47629.1 hypothetical protein [Xanthobacteraceae bacterium]
MNTLTKTLAIVSTFTVLAASTAAFADPGIGPENAEQYRVSAEETLSPYAPANPQLVSQSAQQAPLHQEVNPHWGPAFDPDVE